MIDDEPSRRIDGAVTKRDERAQIVAAAILRGGSSGNTREIATRLLFGSDQSPSNRRQARGRGTVRCTAG
jgi:hypothetical protein